MTIITSKQNTRIKLLRALRHREERERTGLFVIEGVKAVCEAVEAHAMIELLVVAPALLRTDVGIRIVSDQRARGVPILDVDADVFESIVRTVALKYGWQGLAAVVRQRWISLDCIQTITPSYWVALDGVQDPGNLGTILRTSEATGAAGVMLLGSTMDPYAPQAVRASMGAIFSRPLLRTSFEDVRAWADRHGVAIVGTSGSAIADYRSVRYPPRLVLVMGSERHGLSTEQQHTCDMMVSIPMVGTVDSLNLGVATGIVLYEVFEQHRTRNAG